MIMGLIGFFILVAIVGVIMEESCNVSSDSSFALGMLIVFGIYLVSGAIYAIYGRVKKGHHIEELKRNGISTKKCVFNEYDCTIYKDDNKLGYSYLGAAIPGIAATGSFSINSLTTVCVKCRTGYSSHIQIKHDMALGALAELFDVGLILDGNPGDNCIKCIWAEYDTDEIINIIPICCEEIEIDSETQTKLYNINSKIQSTLY